MSREIKFRGQNRRKGEKVRLDGTPIEGKWIYGGVMYNDKGDFCIIYQQEPKIEKIVVYTDTVGQYTGLHDKNGKEIYEGDIIQALSSRGIVTFEKGQWFIKWYSPSPLCPYRHDLYFWTEQDKELEVIGNIYDNPELLEE